MNSESSNNSNTPAAGPVMTSSKQPVQSAKNVDTQSVLKRYIFFWKYFLGFLFFEYVCKEILNFLIWDIRVLIPFVSLRVNLGDLVSEFVVSVSIDFWTRVLGERNKTYDIFLNVFSWSYVSLLI